MDTANQSAAGIRIAIEGCGHGTLHAIYAEVEKQCKDRKWDDIDLLIIGGDFQASILSSFDILRCWNV